MHQRDLLRVLSADNFPRLWLLYTIVFKAGHSRFYIRRNLRKKRRLLSFTELPTFHWPCLDTVKYQNKNLFKNKCPALQAIFMNCTVRTQGFNYLQRRVPDFVPASEDRIGLVENRLPVGGAPHGQVAGHCHPVLGQGPGVQAVHLLDAFDLRVEANSSWNVRESWNEFEFEFELKR